MNEIDFWAVDKKNKPVKAKIYNMLYSLSFSFDIHTKDESTYTCYLTREYYYLNCDLKSRPVIIIDNIYGEVFVVKCIQSPERDAINVNTKLYTFDHIKLYSGPVRNHWLDCISIYF